MNSRFIAGRLNIPADEFVKEFGASVNFDKRLAEFDIAGSIAHATMLAHCKIISPEESQTIINGLNDILAAIKANKFEWLIDLEDVHMNIEFALAKKIGDVSGKLHTARSRNDQIATDIRLWLRAEVNIITTQLKLLINNLVDLAEQEAESIIPGFTHLQVAQPISFGHHILAWVAMLQRDNERLTEGLARINIMPLGSAALAGTTFPIDRDLTAKLLNFTQPSANSLDAVSDRDFAIEFLSTCAILMMHLSRFSEEIILWTSAQFNFISLPDSFCTGSSIMPQKKNPDVAELVRGKTGRVYGHLMSLLTIMKSQPLAYNKDNQEDKEPLFDTVDTIKNCLRVYADMVTEIKVNQQITEKAANSGFATATDLADYLVRSGETFRNAHHIVGNIVAFAIEQDLTLAELTLEQLVKFSDKISADVFNILELTGSVVARNHFGGTAPKQVLQTVKNIRANNKLKPLQ